VEINIVVENGEYGAFYESINNKFESKTGIKANLISDAGESVLPELISGSGYYDVILMDGPEIPKYATLNYLVPLDSYIKPEIKADFYDSALNSCSWKGKLYTLPYLVHGPVIYYRTDLFAAKGLTHAPQSSDEYRQYAKLLTDPAHGIWGSILEGRGDGESVSQWTDKVLQFGGRIIDEKTGKIAVNSKENVAAFEWALSLLNLDKSIPPESINYNQDEARDMLLQGQVAFVTIWPYVWKMSQNTEYSKVVGKVAVAPQPVTSAVWNWSYGIASASKKKDAAWAWIEWATNAENLGLLGTQFLGPIPRKSAMSIATAAITNPSDRATFEAMNKALEMGFAPMLSTNYGELRDRYGLSIHRIFSGEVRSIQAELDQCAKDLQKLLDEAEL
jgi:ABC-type glycerol-3-phosphate transport system substrate-binding protein